MNLAAIQEHAEQSERKTYLDNQLADLVSAMETLEGAIKKIDRETRQRFKETFDQASTPACRNCSRACSAAATPIWN